MFFRDYKSKIVKGIEEDDLEGKPFLDKLPFCLELSVCLCICKHIKMSNAKHGAQS